MLRSKLNPTIQELLIYRNGTPHFKTLRISRVFLQEEEEVENKGTTIDW